MQRMLYWVAAAVGVISGVLSTHSFLAGSWANLVFWALVGIGLGFFASGKREVRMVGIIYGIFLTVAFLLSGFQGTPEKLPGFLLLTAALCIVGALCGWLAVFIGAYVRRYTPL